MHFTPGPPISRRSSSKREHRRRTILPISRPSEEYTRPLSGPIPSAEALFEAECTFTMHLWRL